VPAAVARRTRYDAPAWAEEILGPNPGPAEFDRMHAHGEARKLPRDTDPDTIDDDDVRQAYLEQLQDELDDEPSQDSPGGGPGPVAPGTAPVPSRARRGKWRGALRSDAGGMLGAVDIDDAAGLLLGLVAYAVAVSAFRDPVSATNGVKRWFAAKFLNQTSATGTLTASSPDPQVSGLALLTAPLTETNATPPQPVLSNVGDILRSGLPASVLVAPKPTAIPGAGG